MRQGPKVVLLLVTPSPSSCKLVLPNRMAPADKSVYRMGAFAAGRKSRSAAVPEVVGRSAELMLSFSGMGRPCSAPSLAPVARARSAPRAASSTASGCIEMNAFRTAEAEQRASNAVAYPSAVISPRRIAPAAVTAPSELRSVIAR